MKYNKTRLCIGGMAGGGSAIALVSAAYLLYVIKYKDIGMGVLFAGPLMWSAAIIGVSFAILSAAYLITELSKCDKQKGNLCIGGVAAVTASASLALAVCLCRTGGELGVPLPVIGSLVAAVVVFAALSIFHFIKASSQEKKEAGSNMASVTAQASGLEPKLE